MKRALDLLFSGRGVWPEAVSAVYLAEPVGFCSPNRFYNLAVSLRTSLSPWELMVRCLEIELRLGRKRSGRLEDRIVDLDLLFYGEAIIEGGWVRVPHPRAHERAFVLLPLAEIAPDLKHPVLGKTVQELLRDLPVVSGIRRLGKLDLPGFGV